MQPSRFATALSILCATMLFSASTFATTPSVPTTITNSPKAQFIGSMVTANPDKLSMIQATPTPLNPQFKDCEACNNWLENSVGASSGLTAKFTRGTSWEKYGYVIFIGSCVDSQTGNACSVPE